MTTITFTTITDSYLAARYGDFRIVIDTTNGYINVDQLCAQGVKKEFKDWIKQSSAVELIGVVSIEEKLSGMDIMKVIGGSDDRIRGVYMHPYVSMHIANWVNPKYGFLVSKILLKHKENDVDELRDAIKVMQVTGCAPHATD